MDYQNMSMRIASWVIGLASVVVLAVPGWALEHFVRPVQDQNGNAVAGASVSVYLSGTTTLATLYSDNGIIGKANPFTTAIDGLADFYTADGLIDIKITKTGFPSMFWDAAKLKRLGVFDPHHHVIPYGASFPADPSVGATYALTGDNGTCTEGSGAGVSHCRWSGSSWDVLGGGGGGVSGWPTVSTNKAITWADSFPNAALFGDGVDYWAAYKDPTTGLNFNPVCSGVENGCNQIRKLNTGKYFEIQNNSGASILRITNDTARMTNAIIRDEVHWPVASCQNATAAAIHDLPAANAPTPTCDTGSNTQKGYLAFNDTTEQSFQDHWILPIGFVGTMDVQLRWKGVNTTNAVRWCAQLVRVPDGATSDPSFPAQGAGNCVNDTAKGTTLQENVATISGVTCTSCTGGDHVYVRISRMAADAADTFVGNALLLTYGRISDRILQ